jgi:hypothetical protein
MTRPWRLSLTPYRGNRYFLVSLLPRPARIGYLLVRALKALGSL